MDLTDVSKEALEAEIEKRMLQEVEANKPRMIADPNLGPLRSVCQRYIDNLALEGHGGNDMEHYIFETAMEVLFEGNVFVWVNNHDDY